MIRDDCFMRFEGTLEFTFTVTFFDRKKTKKLDVINHTPLQNQ